MFQDEIPLARIDDLRARYNRLLGKIRDLRVEAEPLQALQEETLKLAESMQCLFALYAIRSRRIPHALQGTPTARIIEKVTSEGTAQPLNDITLASLFGAVFSYLLVGKYALVVSSYDKESVRDVAATLLVPLIPSLILLAFLTILLRHLKIDQGSWSSYLGVQIPFWNYAKLAFWPAVFATVLYGTVTCLGADGVMRHAFDANGGAMITTALEFLKREIQQLLRILFLSYVTAFGLLFVSDHHDRMHWSATLAVALVVSAFLWMVATLAQSLFSVAPPAVLDTGAVTEASPPTGSGEVYTGYMANICASVLAKMSKDRQFSVEWREVSAQGRFDELKTGRIDILCDPATITPERLSHAGVIVSPPVYLSGVGRAVATRDQWAGHWPCIGPLVGIVKGTTARFSIRNMAEKFGFGETFSPVVQAHPDQDKVVLTDEERQSLTCCSGAVASHPGDVGKLAPYTAAELDQTDPASAVVVRSYPDHESLAKALCSGEIYYSVGDLEIISLSLTTYKTLRRAVRHSPTQRYIPKNDTRSSCMSRTNLIPATGWRFLSCANCRWKSTGDMIPCSFAVSSTTFPRRRFPDHLTCSCGAWWPGRIDEDSAALWNRFDARGTAEIDSAREALSI
ncbi:hypothetical protein AL035_21690 [Salipiger aestuarii]|uniref:Extracellular solute-binding protein (Family 3) n=2 Tax=Salipiger aestuarii TaxID=568098 RepID=A0A327XIU9_9RHOB|nr:hypothetical protein AL035_21690 [Salipiger aestuarii]RAK07806.1 extracellular solute-binding protein (family 3) [Salipiger aestuarii]